RRDDVDQTGEVGDPSDLLQLTASAELLGDGDRVDGLVAVEEVADRLEDGLVGRDVEVFRMDAVHHLVDRLLGEEHSPDNRLLGLPGVRRVPVTRSHLGLLRRHRPPSNPQPVTLPDPGVRGIQSAQSPAGRGSLSCQRGSKGNLDHPRPESKLPRKIRSDREVRHQIAKRVAIWRSFRGFATPPPPAVAGGTFPQLRWGTIPERVLPDGFGTPLPPAGAGGTFPQLRWGTNPERALPDGFAIP